MKVDNEAHVTQCTLPQHAGILRYHSVDGLQVCDGEEWKSAGGGAVPMGTIAAFAENDCPSGWVEYTLARGRFLRGRDPSGTVDPDGERMAGHLQDDAFQGHHHNATITGTGAIKREAQTTDGSFHLARISAITATVEDAIGDGVNGTPRIANETRPKNVAVTYCQFTGEGDGLSENTDVLNDLSDVSISGPQIGDTLTYDGTVWVNQDSGSGGGEAVPSGAVMPFDLPSCPSGWSAYAPAQGRFIRGIDSTGTIDPDGVRIAGSLQEDAMQRITGQIRLTHSAIGNPEGVFTGSTNIGSVRNSVQNDSGSLVKFDSGSSPGTRVSDDETRPKNVALLYCRKD